MQTVIKYVNPPKPGKKLGTIKDQTGKLHFFDPARFRLTPGTHDIDFEERPYNGQIYSHVIKVNTGAQASNGSGSSGDRWYMPFVSNTVAHALSAGRIQEPLEIKAWAAAAKQAAIELEQSEGPDGL